MEYSDDLNRIAADPVKDQVTLKSLDRKHPKTANLAQTEIFGRCRVRMKGDVKETLLDRVEESQAGIEIFCPKEHKDLLNIPKGLRPS